ncbi:MAG: C25 family peptidase propeptide domain-containing protein, partial [Candidatus Stygibacter australis]|nr:C25 family peptidase propeptide domain-containing protein [Candidatus Stygibacter australis]
MRKIFLLLLIVIMNFSLWGVHVDIPQTKELVEYQQSDRGSISIEFNLDGYEREEITKDGTKYTRISYPQEGKLLDVGLPDLPVFTRLIAIPDQGTPVLTISAENSFIEKNVLIYPQEKILLE